MPGCVCLSGSSSCLCFLALLRGARPRPRARKHRRQQHSLIIFTSQVQSSEQLLGAEGWLHLVWLVGWVFFVQSKKSKHDQSSQKQRWRLYPADQLGGSRTPPPPWGQRAEVSAGHEPPFSFPSRAKALVPPNQHLCPLLPASPGAAVAEAVLVPHPKCCDSSRARLAPASSSLRAPPLCMAAPLHTHKPSGSRAGRRCWLWVQ